MAELFTIATPIGNLKDISARAIETLKSVDIIAAEDTRTTKILCDKFDIKTRLVSYHKYSEKERVGLILDYLEKGQNVALVTDAGTPLISDPGCVLVKEAYEKGFKITPICGACAIISLLQCVSREGEDFKFVGFLPKSNAQIIDIIEKNRRENLIFYESPKRILKTLEIISNIDTEAVISIGREMTKKFEEITTSNIENAHEHYKNKDEIRGEFVCLIHKTSKNDNSKMENDIDFLRNMGISSKNVAEILAKFKGYNKNLIYKKMI